MKLPHVLYLVALDLPVVFAGAEGCCKFSLSSSGPFACPAGQLDDGQIRLNGTYSTSIFCIDEQGKITDEHGFGCIVTDPPTTQAQCDRDKAPGAGFSIGSDNMLLYNGSPSFFACPATDTEWNVYVAPNFGQPKCMLITLKTDGCGAPPPPPPPTSSSCPAAPPPSTTTVTAWQTQWANSTVISTSIETLWQTQWSNDTATSTSTETQWLTETETETAYEVLPCTSSSRTGWNTTTQCHKCTRTWTGGMPTGTGTITTSTTARCTKCNGSGHNSTSTKMSP